VSSFWRTLPVRLVIVRVVIVIVPFIALFLLVALPLSVPVLNPVACISTADDIMQVAVVSATPSTTLLWWSDAASRVPTGTMPVVIFMTPVFILLVVEWIRYGCCVQHRLEELYMHVYFIIIFGKMRVI
jgi:hypothetical protein